MTRSDTLLRNRGVAQSAFMSPSRNRLNADDAPIADQESFVEQVDRRADVLGQQVQQLSNRRDMVDRHGDGQMLFTRLQRLEIRVPDDSAGWNSRIR